MFEGQGTPSFGGPFFVAASSVFVEGAALAPAELLAREDAQGRLSRATLRVTPVVVRDTASVREAEQALLRSLRKDADGVVARFDRNISLAMSRRLMNFPITPNQVTAFAALVGMMCGFIVSWGGYFPMLLGALAFQFNSILDGVDGEIARAKLLESASGQWLDTLADDASNLCFMIGASVGAYRTWGSPIYLALGAVTAVGFVIASAIMYHYLVTRAHSGDLNDFAMPWEEGPQGRKVLTHDEPQGSFSRLIAKIKWVSRRDAYVFFSVVFGLLGQLRVMVWFFAVGTTIAWMTIAAYRVVLPLFRRPATQSS
jgi:phosphatidylglycerophosphate synthase